MLKYLTFQGVFSYIHGQNKFKITLHTVWSYKERMQNEINQRRNHRGDRCKNDALTLFQQGGADSAQHRRGCTKNFPCGYISVNA